MHCRRYSVAALKKDAISGQEFALCTCLSPKSLALFWFPIAKKRFEAVQLEAGPSVGADPVKSSALVWENSIHHRKRSKSDVAAALLFG